MASEEDEPFCHGENSMNSSLRDRVYMESGRVIICAVKGVNYCESDARLPAQ